MTEHALNCCVCNHECRMRHELEAARIDRQDSELERLTLEQQKAYIERLGLVHTRPSPGHTVPDGRTIVCEACHAEAVMAVTHHIEASEGLLEWVWRDLNTTLAAMLTDNPGRGFSGDDSYDDFKGVVGMLSELMQTYFDTDLVAFADWLRDGPQFVEDPRRALLEAAGFDEFDDDAMMQAMSGLPRQLCASCMDEPCNGDDGYGDTCRSEIQGMDPALRDA